MLVLIAVFVLILLSAFFSGAETGLTIFNGAKINKLSASGNKAADIVLKISKDKGKLISTVLLCNNLVNVLSAAIMTDMMLKLFGESGVIYATILMTALILLFGEILPKTYALHNPEKVSLSSASSIFFLIKLFHPVTRGIKFFTDSAIKFFLPKGKLSSISSAKDSLRDILLSYKKECAISQQDFYMINSALDIDDIDVSQVMTRNNNIISINIENDIDNILDALVTSNHSRMPIWRDSPDNIIGILHLKDVLKAINAKEDIDNAHLEKLSLRPWFIRDTVSLKSQLSYFRKYRRHFAVVLDEDNAMQGIITLHDILTEIVGEVQDEHYTKSPYCIPIQNGEYYVHGEYYVRDLNRLLDLNLSDEHVTIGDLLRSAIDRYPKINDEINIGGISIVVLNVEDGVIEEIKICKNVN